MTPTPQPCPYATHPDTSVKSVVDLPASNLANDIQTAYPSMTMCVNREFTNNTTGMIDGEVDIELDHIIIEYKTLSSWKGQSAGIQRQISNLNKRTVNFNAKPIVHYLPNIHTEGSRSDDYQPSIRGWIEKLPNVRAAFGKKKLRQYIGRDGNNQPIFEDQGVTRDEFISLIPSLNVP